MRRHHDACARRLSPSYHTAFHRNSARVYSSPTQRGCATASGMLYGSNAILKSIAPLWVWGHEKEKEDVAGRQCENGFEGNLQEEGVERRILTLLRQCSSGVLRHGFVYSRRGRGTDDAERN